MADNIVYAGFFRRFFAGLLDGVIIVVFNFAIGFVINLMFGWTDVGAIIGSGISSIISLVVSFGYAIYFIGSRGQTPGKMILGIKVVKTGTSEVPGYMSAFLREVVGKLISSLVFFLGFLWMLWDPQKQTWHDKIAGTIVVKV